MLIPSNIASFKFRLNIEWRNNPPHPVILHHSQASPEAMVGEVPSHNFHFLLKMRELKAAEAKFAALCAAIMRHPITIHDKKFYPFLSAKEIKSRVKTLAKAINQDYKDKSPLFIAVLNGSFMFTADLMKRVVIPSEVSFVKLASYRDMESSGRVNQLIGLNENVLGRNVIIVEDIIDSGITITGVLDLFRSLGPESLEVVTLLRKPQCLEAGIDLKYVGFDIPDKFVVGYGLDYNGLGRNLHAIFQYKD